MFDHDEQVRVLTEDEQLQAECDELGLGVGRCAAYKHTHRKAVNNKK